MEAVVKRVTGFRRDFEFVAEVTTRTTDGGFATVREFGNTVWGAVARAEVAARRRLTSRRWAAGFTADGYRDDTRNGATFAFGFA